MLTAARSQDFWTGVIFIALGTAVSYLARGYEIGTAVQMGPGYFPAALGAILAVLGLVLLFRVLIRGQKGDTVSLSFRPLVILTLSVIGFALMLPWAGLMVTVSVTVLIVSFARNEAKLVESVILAALLSIANTAIFVIGLSIPIRLWPSF